MLAVSDYVKVNRRILEKYVRRSPILEKMEHEKFHRLTELYEVTYGKEIYVDFQRNDEKRPCGSSWPRS